MLRFFYRFIPIKIKFFLKSLYNNLKNLYPIAKRTCPICNFKGNFYPFGRPPRNDAQCPSCYSLERHRLFYLLLNSKDSLVMDEKNTSILHFAPEHCLSKFFKKYQNYVTADISGKKVDQIVDIENIKFPNKSFDIIIVNHVFEHVNDLEAFKQISKVLKNEGLLITSVPIIYGWHTTYENHDIKNETDKIIHFGQHDHVRYYGSDFVTRVTSNSNLKLFKSFGASKSDEIKYGLLRGEHIYVFKN